MQGFIRHAPGPLRNFTAQGMLLPLSEVSQRTGFFRSWRIR